MIVNYQLIGGAWTLLFNEAAGDACEKFLCAFDDNVQSVPGYGLASEIKIPQSNTKGTSTFKFSRNYASPDAVEADIAAMRIGLKGKTVHLQRIQGATTTYLKNAVLKHSDHDPHGKECMHTLTFDHDDMTLN